MIDLIKKIWAGPTAVKVSLVFVFLVLFVHLVNDALGTVFAIAIFYSVFRLVKWLEYGE